MPRTLRALLPALGLVAGLLAFQPAAAASNVGQHIHVEVANMPVDGYPISGPYTFHITIRLHDYPAAVQYLRIDDSSTTRAKRTFSPALAGGGDVAYTFDWTVDFSGWATGRHELRFHADSKDADPLTPDTQRQYTTSRWQVCVKSCSPNLSGRATPFIGGGSWYTGPGYVVPLVLSPDTEFRPGGTIRIKSQYQSHICAYLNPDFHHGSHGVALGCTSTVHIPDDAQVGDKLVVVADTTQEAGVFQTVLGDGTPRKTAFYATQSWWAKDGLSIP